MVSAFDAENLGSIPELSSDGRVIVGVKHKTQLVTGSIPVARTLSILTANKKITLIFSIKRHLFDSGGSRAFA